MPYIAIKSWPKDEETKKKVIEKINQVFIEEWGCPPEAITISHEEIKPEDWQEKVVEKEIIPNPNVKILSGQKKY
ncbi:MAG: tautomerase family protein [Clostridia bacterium]|nr:tautomerase family protein [Clostridia bacterium]